MNLEESDARSGIGFSSNAHDDTQNYTPGRLTICHERGWAVASWPRRRTGQPARRQLARTMTRRKQRNPLAESLSDIRREASFHEPGDPCHTTWAVSMGMSGRDRGLIGASL